MRRYDAPAKADDYAYALAMSPLGSALFVTGESLGSPSYDYATVAYSLIRNEYGRPPTMSPAWGAVGS